MEEGGEGKQGMIGRVSAVEEKEERPHRGKLGLTLSFLKTKDLAIAVDSLTLIRIGKAKTTDSFSRGVKEGAIGTLKTKKGSLRTTLKSRGGEGDTPTSQASAGDGNGVSETKLNRKGGARGRGGKKTKTNTAKTKTTSITTKKALSSSEDLTSTSGEVATKEGGSGTMRKGTEEKVTRGEGGGRRRLRG